jgi:hypothetical protein
MMLPCQGETLLHDRVCVCVASQPNVLVLQVVLPVIV